MKEDEERARVLAGVGAAPPLLSTRFEGKGGKVGQRLKGGVFAQHAGRQIGKQGGTTAMEYQ